MRKQIGIEILPCPYCNSKTLPNVRFDDGWKNVFCWDCGARGPNHIEATGAIRSWNKLSMLKNEYECGVQAFNKKSDECIMLSNKIQEGNAEVERNAFVRGYICSVANQIRDHGMRTEVCDNWKGVKITLSEMKSRGVDDYDIEVLKEHWEELNH
jgi:hypothetical protein